MNTSKDKIHWPLGFSASGMNAKISYKPTRKDLALFYSRMPATGAGVFTANQVKAAPVVITQKNLLETRGQVRAIVVNSGQANAANGKPGFDDALTAQGWAAERLNVPKNQVWLASTGVIGPRLRLKGFQSGLKTLSRRVLEKDVNEGHLAAEAIMTTDTVPKVASLRFEIGGVPVRIWGCAKGSGMIHPVLTGPRGQLHATMLGFILTDAAVSGPALQRCLEWVADKTFNCVSIDGDTSTNDFVALLANGASGMDKIQKPIGPHYSQFRSAVLEICDRLANKIAEDGEGASKLVQIFIEGARSEKSARQMASVVAASPLVKTAIHGADPNWGRVLMAIGRSGVKFSPEKVRVWIGDTLVCSRGREYPFSEKKVIEYMRNKRIIIRVDLGLGKKWSRYRTCDFTGQYVGINAGYRT